MTIDYAALAERAAAEGKDMTQAKAGGDFERELPAAGMALVRFVGYIEVGKQNDEYMGQPKVVEKAYLQFEVCRSKARPGITLADGRVVPHIITVELNLSDSAKSHSFKLFNRLNFAGKTKHFVGLLGSPYKAEIIHRKYAARGEDKAKPETWTGVAVELFNKTTKVFTIEPPRREVQDEETGEVSVVDLKVPPAETPIKAFVWAYADKAMWDSIFIAGEWPAREAQDGKPAREARSKNVFQLEIKEAVNFKGSPIHQILAGGVLEDLGEEAETKAVKGTAKPAAKAAPKDALGDLGLDDDIPF